MLGQIAQLDLRYGSGRTSSELLDPRAMRSALMRERARADRYHGSFSLVTIGPAKGSEALSLRLREQIASRTRETDCAGWVDDRRLGVLLAATDAAGAKEFAASLRRIAEAMGEAVEIDSDSYGDGSDGGGGWGGGRGVDLQIPAGLAESPRIGVLVAQRTPLSKRILDIVGAAVGLAVSMPVLLAAAAAIKLTSPGPVVFKQWRSGLGGVPFRMYKLRTMVTDAEQHKSQLRERSEQDGPAFKMRSDPRVTRVGRFLRRTSIDEIPQLWNVLRGEMSLVGPRPLPCEEMAACRPWQRRRLDVTPGLTGLWQVEGRSRVSFLEWARMDAWYARNRTFLGDLLLILRTIPAVLVGRGAC